MSDSETAPGEEGFETRAIHAGRDFVGETGAVTPPVWLSSTFEYGNPNGFDYTRSGNPNFRLLDRTIATLEGGAHATVFGSGVSAITAIVSTLKSGDLVVAEENVYGCTYRLFEQVFAKFGISVTYLDLTRDEAIAGIPELNPALVWIESPTNPLLKILDIAAIAEVSHAAGAPLVVDNTFASSYPAATPRAGRGPFPRQHDEVQQRALRRSWRSRRDKRCHVAGEDGFCTEGAWSAALAV